MSWGVGEFNFGGLGGMEWGFWGERGWKELSIIIDLLLAIPDEIKSKVNTTKCIS